MEELSIRRSAIGSASGSVDLFGGFAKAAGSLAIRSLSEPKTTVLLTEIADSTLRLSSTHRGRFSAQIEPFRSLVKERATMAELRTWLESVEAPQWTFHVVGCLYLFCATQRWLPEEGLSFAIASDLPPRHGFSGGIALKTASVRALEKLSSCYTRPEQFQRMALEVDRDLLAIPFDPSTPIAAALNKPGQLLPISCQRQVALSPVELPRGITLFTWSRPLDHPRSSDRYHDCAIGAAMARRIAAADGGLDARCGLPRPSLLSLRESFALPQTLNGGEFETRYGCLESSFGWPARDRHYPARPAFEFAVHENRRVELAVHILQSMSAKNKRRTMEHLGELLWESHFQAWRLGLRAPEAERMTQALLEAGPANGIYGGRLNLLGHHCSMLVLAEKRSIPFLRRLARSMGPETALLQPII